MVYFLFLTQIPPRTLFSREYSVFYIFFFFFLSLSSMKIEDSVLRIFLLEYTSHRSIYKIKFSNYIFTFKVMVLGYLFSSSWCYHRKQRLINWWKQHDLRRQNSHLLPLPCIWNCLCAEFWKLSLLCPKISLHISHQQMERKPQPPVAFLNHHY